VVVEKDADGYIAFCPELEGCYSQGDTYEELMENIRDAIQLHIQDRIAMGEEIETYDFVSLTSLEVTV
jgi:predicted RNase H-like HicB family nuclease